VLKTVSSVQHAFKTPSLRQVDRRRPYMHDGSLPDLDAVIEHYVKGGEDRPSRSPDMRPVALTAPERADLLAFLAALSGPEPGVIAPVLPR
jgi:cytochrome c peroxidase